MKERPPPGDRSIENVMFYAIVNILSFTVLDSPGASSV